MAFVTTTRLLSLLSLSSLFLSSSVHAICVPRNSTQGKPAAAPPKIPAVSSPPPAKPSLIIGPVLFQKPTLLATSLKADDGLTKICGQTDNPVLCVTSISTLLNGDVNPLTVFKAAVKFTSDVVKDAIEQANKLSADTSISTITASCIQTCKENFGSAIDDLQSSIEALEANDVGRRQSVLSAVLTDLSTCDDSFSEMNLESPFEELSTKLNKLASNCLAISQLL